MNDLRPFSPLCGAVLLSLALGCGGLGDFSESTPAWGAWKITAVTGSVTMVDSGCHVGTWTFTPDPQSSWNGVKVESRGEVKYYLGFHGVEGSPFPDSFNIAGSGVGESGKITWRVVREDLGTETTITGTYDGETMHGEWTHEQHTGVPGSCWTDVTGSGTFDAVRE